MMSLRQEKKYPKSVELPHKKGIIIIIEVQNYQMSFAIECITGWKICVFNSTVSEEIMLMNMSSPAILST